MKELSYTELLDTLHILNDVVRHEQSKVTYATQNKAQSLLKECIDELELRLQAQ